MYCRRRATPATCRAPAGANCIHAATSRRRIAKLPGRTKGCSWFYCYFHLQVFPGRVILSPKKCKNKTREVLAQEKRIWTDSPSLTVNRRIGNQRKFLFSCRFTSQN